MANKICTAEIKYPRSMTLIFTVYILLWDTLVFGTTLYLIVKLDWSPWTLIAAMFIASAQISGKTFHRLTCHSCHLQEKEREKTKS